MNNPIGKAAAAALVILAAAPGPALSAERVRFTKSLTDADRRCLTELLRTGSWRVPREAHREMIEAAAVGRADLKGDGRKQYIFYIEGSTTCGTAGCTLIIGEPRQGGTCRELYDGPGLDAAVTVLRKRDYHYRRLYTPCEIRFNEYEYWQVREECPNAVIQR
jgi:hypothetical protein